MVWDVYVVCLWGSIAVCASLPEDVEGQGCKSGALLERVIGPGVGAGLSLHFLRKQWLLSVILPDPSTLIQCC